MDCIACTFLARDSPQRGHSSLSSFLIDTFNIFQSLSGKPVLVDSVLSPFTGPGVEPAGRLTWYFLQKITGSRMKNLSWDRGRLRKTS